MARTDPSERFRRARSAQSPEQRRAGEGNASASGDTAVERKVRITVDLPASLHRRLRLAALDEDTDGQAVVRRALSEYLDRQHPA